MCFVSFSVSLFVLFARFSTFPSLTLALNRIALKVKPASLLNRVCLFIKSRALKNGAAFTLEGRRFLLERCIGSKDGVKCDVR